MSTSKHTQAPLNDHGVIYVEFLFAFFPLFTMFLAICQIALATTAGVLVGQAANQGARAAIVALEEDPANYDGTLRGDLSGGVVSERDSLGAFTEALGLASFDRGSMPSGLQHGARMGPIRQAAYSALLPLAPSPAAFGAPSSLGNAVQAGWLDYLDFSVQYTRAAAAVSIIRAPGSDRLVSEQVARKADVTVRVAYAFHCSVPLIRVLLCSTIQHITAPDVALSEDGTTGKVGILAQAELPDALRQSAQEGARFLVLASEITLPNQGAGYY